jgi:hypothetical protein
MIGTRVAEAVRGSIVHPAECGPDKENGMLDLAMLGFTLFFFAASLGYLEACDHL